MQTLKVGEGSLPPPPTTPASEDAGFPADLRSILTFLASTMLLLLLLLLLLLSSDTILFSKIVTLFFTAELDDEDLSSPLSEVTAAATAAGFSSAGIVVSLNFTPFLSRILWYLPSRKLRRFHFSAPILPLFHASLSLDI